MIDMEKPAITCLQNAQDGSYGEFVIEPLERGYGITLGNSLRRVLLSSLPGAAVPGPAPGPGPCGTAPEWGCVSVEEF
ncbi:MAG: hypothetical protein EOM68_26620 [Spirochaetia bacterium]|nr:hypothetical protein [Spirochaetia bacterium]